MRLHLVLMGTAVLLAGRPVQAAEGARSPMVVVISQDAFAAKSLREADLPAPTLRAMMATGAYARSMQPINPTVTWPNHTAMVTGVSAAKHHVVVNGLIEGQRGATAPKINPKAPKSELVQAPTVYDAAHAAKLTTAEVDWVAIGKPGTIDWSFAEAPDPGSPIVQDLLRDGTMSESQLDEFNEPSQAWRDRMYTAAAVDILRRHHPNLLLLHLLSLDSIEHETGYGNDSGRNTIAFLDDRVKEVVDAVREAGDGDRTTFLIVSDHGQSSLHFRLDANALLRAKGLQGSAAARLPEGDTYAINEGGFALVYQQHATAESTRALQQLFAGQPGVRSALTAEEAVRDGWPIPAKNGQAPDLLLYAKNDYAFSNEKTGAFVTPTREAGAHGYPNTEPLMQAIFVASGRGIRRAGEIPSFPNVDVAPTIARLLGISLPTADGTALTSILQ